MLYVAIAILTAGVFALAVLWNRARAAAAAAGVERDELKARYSPIIDVQAEATAAKADIQKLRDDQTAAEKTWAQKRAELKAQYEAALVHHEALKKDIGLLEEKLEDISYGLYTPHYSFDTPESYKARLGEIRERQKQMVRDGTAAVSRAKWEVAGSKADGAKMTKQYLKILLRDFNAECDAAVAIVTWNNVTKMEERIRKSFESINQLGTVMQMSISTQYLDLKLAELRLAYEYEEKRYQAREEQRQLREQLREEEKAQREMEKAKAEAEKEEQRYLKALTKAREEATAASGVQLAKLTEQIQALEAQVQAAQEKERAISMAQQTKAGHVYVISNIGSFGENVLKIGMTRRLDPEERVYELGDASVPFPFDIHALIPSTNAPELERQLHQHFEPRRRNWVNPRKEFFDVSLDAIEAFVQEKGLEVQLAKIAEAKEYRKTLAMREAKTEEAVVTAAAPRFPASPFDEPAGAAV